MEREPQTPLEMMGTAAKEAGTRLDHSGVTCGSATILLWNPGHLSQSLFPQSKMKIVIVSTFFDLIIID